MFRCTLEAKIYFSAKLLYFDLSFKILNWILFDLSDVCIQSIKRTGCTDHFGISINKVVFSSMSEYIILHSVHDNVVNIKFTSFAIVAELLSFVLPAYGLKFLLVDNCNSLIKLHPVALFVFSKMLIFGTFLSSSLKVKLPGACLTFCV